jgi:hypothetical protein
VSNTYCVFVLFVIVPCLVYLVLPVSLDGSFAIASSVFSNVYLLNTLFILFSHEKLTRYDYNLTIMESPKLATDNRFKK